MINPSTPRSNPRWLPLSGVVAATLTVAARYPLLKTIRTTTRRVLKRTLAWFNRIPILERLAARKHMRLIDALSRSFSANNLACYFVGGYALDALRGKLSRRHRDLDIAVLERDAEAALSILKNHRFTIRVKAPYVWGANREDVTVDVFCWKGVGYGIIEHVAACGMKIRIPGEFMTSAQSVELLGARFMVPSNEYIASVSRAYGGEADDLEFGNALPTSVRLELRQSTEVSHGVNTKIYEYKPCG